MSGGVDSSLVAYMLKEAGYEVIGITMKQLDSSIDEKLNKPCCSLEDILDAKKICHSLNIPHYTINLQELFKEKIIDYFVDEYRKGNTPNPCVKCNRDVKIGKLLEYAEDLGMDYLATGHYAILENDNLYASVDEHKDQSYFLSRIQSDKLSKLIFPLGKFTKPEVIEMAKKFSLIKREKPESQGICFIGSGYKSFLNRHLDNIPGDIYSIEGELLGRHDGIYNYTIGQRKGISVPGEFAYYVVDIDADNNRVIIGQEKDLYVQALKCNQINLLVPVEEIDQKICYVKTRARDIKNRALVELSKDGFIIKFVEGVRAITRGQIAVIYNEKNQVLASGIIF